MVQFRHPRLSDCECRQFAERRNDMLLGRIPPYSTIRRYMAAVFGLQRTAKTRNCVSAKSGSALLYQLAMSAQKRWRQQDYGVNLPEVSQGFAGALGKIDAFLVAE